MKRLIFLIFILAAFKTFAQTNGITYQAVIFNPSTGNGLEKALANQKVCMSFKILTNDTDVDYEESMQTITDQFGAVNLLIGTGNKIRG